MSNIRRAKDSVGKWWSQGQKIEAVQAYIVFGKAPQVEAVTGIPRGTIAQWRTQEWWKELESELRSEDDIELSGRLKRTLDKSLEVVTDRLEHGDFSYDQKTGTLIRKPVSMRDAHQVTKDLIDKRRVLDNKPTHITENRVEDRLLVLAQKFEEFASSFKMKEIKGETLDAEDYREISTTVESEGEVRSVSESDSALSPS